MGEKVAVCVMRVVGVGAGARACVLGLEGAECRRKPTGKKGTPEGGGASEKLCVGGGGL